MQSRSHLKTGRCCCRWKCPQTARSASLCSNVQRPDGAGGARLCAPVGLRRGAGDEGSENLPNLRGHQRHPPAFRGSERLPGNIFCFLFSFRPHGIYVLLKTLFIYLFYPRPLSECWQPLKEFAESPEESHRERRPPCRRDHKESQKVFFFLFNLTKKPLW